MAQEKGANGKPTSRCSFSPDPSFEETGSCDAVRADLPSTCLFVLGIKKCLAQMRFTTEETSPFRSVKATKIYLNLCV